eukprot:CAMPEP_0178406350 /NCGR_PEP_ID=MMETSP0689_2-20121128/18867_1 /TAXON_ID=160604 /ORGANISM="Amphidinium massartii, Strain CS-259" /LENGTH=208 /DNA_ID=CAMNT_0020027389 /DNA_START=69 /DNA_END=695 /DNA_ORIENTATION=+
MAMPRQPTTKPQRQLLVALLGLVFLSYAPQAFTGAFGATQAPRSVARSAFAECSGRCRGDGTWTDVQTIEVESEENAKGADKAWELFQKQFPKAVANGIFMDTPVEEDDVKYRWHRLCKTAKLSPEDANKIMEEDALPLVVDSDHVQNTFFAMVRGSDYETAKDVVMKNPGILTAGDGIEDNMEMAKVAAVFQQGTRPLNKFLQGILR